MHKSIADLQNDWRPRTKTGKTQFKRKKAQGESWTALRSKEWGADYVCKEKWVK
jgi:hypothetical protein